MKLRLRRLAGKIRLDGRDIVFFGMSLLLAFSIWLIHNLSLNYSETVSVPVVAECNLDGHSNRSSNAGVVAARCRTSGFSLVRNRYQHSRSAQVIRFEAADMHHREGELFYVTASDLAGYVNDIFGESARLESILSDEVTFRFPYENHKRVPVQVVAVLNFRPQYTAMGPVRLQPDSVTVYGEPFHLEQVDRVMTRTITLSDIHGGAHGSVKLEPVSGLRMSDTEVNYSLDVTRYVEIHSEVTVSMRNVPAGRKVSVFPSMAKVTYKCAFPLSTDPSSGVRFFIDYKDFEGSIGGRCIPRPVSLPDGVLDYSLEPEVFECVEEGRQ